MFVRELDPHMGIAVAKRTYFNGNENWQQVAERVALGNTLLHSTGERDRIALTESIAKATFLTAGRHLQHGSASQPSKNLELFSNCSTACTSFLEFLLLLNGSGVGRNYSDDMLMVDFNNMPHVYCVLSKQHPDFYNRQYTTAIAVEDTDKYPENPDLYHVIEDSREGWAKAFEILEVAAYQNRKHDNFVFDFSMIRENGKPIRGMQNRPASGPMPLILAFQKAAAIKYTDYPVWKQTMMIDHALAECVANGGARRSSRIAIKYWKDPEILEFINIKNDYPELWSSNNSIGVDKEYWDMVPSQGSWAERVFLEATEKAYGVDNDRPGEPGFLALDRLTVVE